MRPTGVASSTRRLGIALTMSLSAALLTACGDVVGSLPGSGGDLVPPPPVTVRYGDKAVVLHPYTYCYGNGCADGMPPKDPPDVGSPDEVEVDFPLDGWSFEATFTADDTACGRAQTVGIEKSDDGSATLAPVGRAGSYVVTLFGRGDGDLVTTFRWTTPSDGSLPRPRAQIAVLADNDGEVDSYGVELGVSNLATTPERVSATVTVTAANSRSLTFDATHTTQTCLPEGSVAWGGPDDDGLAAARLGPGPFTYRVVLMLDGARHVATARWPDDEIRGNEPSVGLRFTPALPAMRAAGPASD